MFPPPRSQDPDASIRLTDSDAAGARLSAVQKHYLRDPFIKYLIPRAHLLPPRPPLINIGTFIRSTAIDDLVHQWLKLSELEGNKCQIVSLGSGSDTRFWRLATSLDKDRIAAYIEIDFPEVTGKKAMAIRKSKELSAVLGDPVDIKLSHGGAALNSPIYHLLPADLRLPPSETLSPLLASPVNTTDISLNPLLSPTLPTLLLFECVLVYMSPASSSALIEWFVSYFAKHTEGPGSVLGSIVYEMFGLNDSFGKVMLSNLQSRNVSLPGAEPYPSVSSLPKRLFDHEFTISNALTLRDIRRSYVDRAELKRISKLELLDEIEELELVLQHYAITWGLRLFGSSSAQVKWKTWGLQPQIDFPEENNG